MDKNRDREPFSFANINLLGKCNVRCFFCLGEDIPEELGKHNQLRTHFSEWKNFHAFLDRCTSMGVRKLYVTGQNTDSLLYTYLDELIDELYKEDFQVGLRTNGYRALEEIDTINKCELSTGYSIHSLNPVTTKMILGRKEIPDWERIIPLTERPRVQIVLNRCNEHEFWDVLRYVTKFPNVRYVQVRKPCTDTREELLTPDMAAYERVYTRVRDIFPRKKQLWGDADVYEIYGKDVVFWRTVKTTVNSLNYFTDGTISDMYFVVEGYLTELHKHRGEQ
jgi:molybdenum cofactor biosynthesis enzyme MoaA